MIVICEECGKKYRIDPVNIKGQAASFKCRACEQVIVVSKPDSPAPVYAAPQPASEPVTILESITSTADGGSTTALFETEVVKSATRETEAQGPRRVRRFGLRARMLVLFLFIPMIFMAGASLFYLWHFKTTTDLLARENSKVINRMAEEKIADISAAVAIQCKIYLLSHPELKKEDFNRDAVFKSLAVQKLGLSGYTALYQLPGSDGVWRTWAHINPKLIGVDMIKLENSLGRNFPGFWKVFSGVKGRKESRGYYTWQDNNSKSRDKFMVCTSIAGTRFVIAATTYMDDFTGPLRMMGNSGKALTDKLKIVTLAIVGATLLIVGIIVTIYGHRLTGKIRTLTEVADRISAGELGMEIEAKSKDEIGDLAEAIARMQDSIQLSRKSQELLISKTKKSGEV